MCGEARACGTLTAAVEELLLDVKEPAHALANPWMAVLQPALCRLATVASLSLLTTCIILLLLLDIFHVLHLHVVHLILIFILVLSLILVVVLLLLLLLARGCRLATPHLATRAPGVRGLGLGRRAPLRATSLARPRRHHSRRRNGLRHRRHRRHAW